MTHLRILPCLLLLVACARGGELPDGGDVDVPDADETIIDGGTADRVPRIDATPRPDADPTLPDAAPLPDGEADVDAASGTCSWQSLLDNGTFDSGGGWVESPTGIITTTGVGGVTPYSPSRMAHFGSASNASDVLYQDVSIPAGATLLRLRGQRCFVGDTFGFVYENVWITIEPTAGGTVEFLCDSAAAASGCEVTTDATYTNLDIDGATCTWTSFTITTTSAHPGQAMRLRLQADLDSPQVGDYYFDSLRLEAGVGTCP